MNTHRLPLHEKHAQKSARFGAFGDWEVPLYYSTILEEHEAVRTRAGLFDISHMGNFSFEGPAALSFLESLLPRPVAPLAEGQALYMPLLNEEGGILDDIILYRISPSRFFMIVNASNVQKDEAWIAARAPKDAGFRNLSDRMGLLALQGPRAAAILSQAFPDKGFEALKYYRFKIWGAGMAARTGYTGEDGFELMLPLEELPGVWDKLFEAGSPGGLVPAGFGARDTLRLEAAMPLYGHDMNDDTTPFESAVGWAVNLEKEISYPGRDVLRRRHAAGDFERRLAGFEMVDRGIPRQDYDIVSEGRSVGRVTSGTFSPTLKKNIGLGFVPPSLAAPGSEIFVRVRDKDLKARVITTPFYKRKK